MLYQKNFFSFINKLTICYIFYIGVYSNVNLTPPQLHVIENSSATLTCSKTGGDLLESRWENSQFPGQVANLYYDNGRCVVTYFLKNGGMFNGLCNGNGTFSVLLKKINRTQHGAEWKCMLNAFEQSNTLITKVTGIKV